MAEEKGVKLRYADPGVWTPAVDFRWFTRRRPYTRSVVLNIYIGSIAEKRDRDADVQGRKRPVATVIMHVWSAPHVQGRKRPVGNILTSNRQETGILTSNV